jgi:hypothetical protein
MERLDSQSGPSQIHGDVVRRQQQVSLLSLLNDALRRLLTDGVRKRLRI